MTDRDTNNQIKNTIDNEDVSHNHYQSGNDYHKREPIKDIYIDKEFIQNGLCNYDHTIRPTEEFKSLIIQAFKLAVTEVLKKRVCTYEEISKVSEYEHTNVPIFLPQDVYLKMKERLRKTSFRCVGDETNINRLMLSIETSDNETTDVVVNGINFQFNTHIVCGSALVCHELTKYYKSIDPSPEPFRNIKRRASQNHITGKKYSIFEFVWNNSHATHTHRGFRNMFSGKSLEEFMSKRITHDDTSSVSSGSTGDKPTCSIDDLLHISSTYPEDKVLIANALKSLKVTDSLYELIKADIVKTFKDYLENKHVQVVDVPEIRARVDPEFMSISDKLTGFCVRNIDVFSGLRERLSRKEMDRYDVTGVRLRRNTFTFRLDTSVPNNLFVSKYVTCKISDILSSVEVMDYIRHFYENMVLINKGITDIKMNRHKWRNEDGSFKYGMILKFTFEPIEQEHYDVDDDIDNVTNGINAVVI